MIELKISPRPSFFNAGICKCFIHIPENSSTQHFYAFGINSTSVSTTFSVQPAPYFLRIYGVHQPCVPYVTCLVEGSVIRPSSVTLAETFGICSVTKSVTEIYTDGSYFLNVPTPYLILSQPDGVTIHKNPLAINLVTPSQNVCGDDVQIVLSSKASDFAEIKVSTSIFTRISSQFIIGNFIQYIYPDAAQTSYLQFSSQFIIGNFIQYIYPDAAQASYLQFGVSFISTSQSDSITCMSRDMPLQFVLNEAWSGSLPLNFDLTCVSGSASMSRDMPLQFVLDTTSDRAMPLTAIL